MESKRCDYDRRHGSGSGCILRVDVQDHYDFRRGVRGKHAAQFAAGTNVVRLDSDVAEKPAVVRVADDKNP